MDENQASPSAPPSEQGNGRPPAQRNSRKPGITVSVEQQLEGASQAALDEIQRQLLSAHVRKRRPKPAPAIPLAAMLPAGMIGTGFLTAEMIKEVASKCAGDRTCWQKEVEAAKAARKKPELG